MKNEKPPLAQNKTPSNTKSTLSSRRQKNSKQTEETENKSRSLVMHLDIDAFFASVEQLRNPRIAKQAVAVGTGVIASCSYSAREYGLYAGMPLREAQRLCPQLIVIEGHQAIYSCYAERVFEHCHKWAPQVESYLDEAFCDLHGTQRLYPDPLVMGTQLRQDIFQELGLEVSIGFGRNRMLAKLAAGQAKPNGIFELLPQQEEGFLLNLPLSKIPGIGPKTQRKLEQVGIESIEKLREISLDALMALFGPANGRSLYNACRAKDYRVVQEDKIPQSLSRETTFHQDTHHPEEIEGMLHYLMERAARSLRQQKLEAGGLSVKIVYSDFMRKQSRIRLKPQTALDSILIPSAMSIYRQLHQRRVSLRHIGIALDRLRPEQVAIQSSLFEFEYESTPSNQHTRQKQQLPTQEQLSTKERLQEKRLLSSLDEIRTRFGHAALITGKSLHMLASPEQEEGAGDGKQARKLKKDNNGFILRTPCLTK